MLKIENILPIQAIFFSQ